MTSFGKWLKQVPPLRAAIGLVLLLFTASFSLGAASVNLVGLPARTAELEEASLRTDSILEQTLDRLERHIQQDSVITACIYEVVYLMAEGTGPINPLTCGRPGGSNE